MPPAPGGAPPQPPQGGAPGQPPVPPGATATPIPPEFQRQLNPGNPLQQALLQRVDRLTPQDIQSLGAGIQPPAAQVLKKIFPEIGFLLDQIGQQGGGGDGQQPGGMPGAMPGAPGGPQPGGPNPPGSASLSMGGPPRTAQPGTRLNDI
jgi:hypothetical protein